MTSPIIEMRDITKTFGLIQANRGVNLEIYPGEIHALLGENGAGKSTLMNILMGVYTPDGGEIYYKGKRADIRTPKDAVACGIGMVHQHFRLIPTLTVAENVFLYSDNKKFFLKKDQIEREISDYANKFNLHVDASAYVWQLSVGEQQRVEIVKLLYQGAEILILDEPSAVLTPQEAQHMFDTLRKMANDGKAVIVISHKMNEVMSNADRITVLKGGQVGDTMLAADATIERLTKAVVGSENETQKRSLDRAPGEDIVFAMENVSALNDRNLPALKGVSMYIRKGEIFGIAGVAGNGQRELSEVITGLRPVTAGEIRLNGKDITKTSVRGRINAGISFIPEDRRTTGLVMELDMKQNLILKDYGGKKYSRRGILKKNQVQQDADAYTEAYEIKHAGVSYPVGLMSGGNQQKLLFAREVAGNPDLIVAAYPVRGLDIGAAETIRQILLEQSWKGAAVLFISEELEEIFSLCDRVGVLCDGEMMGIREIGQTDIMEIGRLMTGESGEEPTDLKQSGGEGGIR